MTLLRSLIYVCFLYGSLALVGLVFAPLALFDQRAGKQAVRTWSAIGIFGARWICGIKVEVRGTPPTTPALYAAKHQSMLDTLIPFVVLADPCLVIKAELQSMPVYGWYTQRSGMIAVARETHASALKTMLRAARTAAQAGRQVFIFPEGTRQPLGAPPDYKPGVAALYRDLGLPCVPIALNSGLCWKPTGLERTPGVVVFEFLEPIPPGLSREAFMHTLETRIETASTALLPPGHPASTAAVPAARASS